MLSLAAITVVLRSNFIRPSQLIAALIRPKALFVTSPHPLATVTVFPRPCGLLEALKHGLHSYFGATPRRAFSSAAHCFCGLTVRRCGHSLCVLNFSRFLARLCGWCGIAVLPCFSASGKVPVTRCRLPLLGTYAAYCSLRAEHRPRPSGKEGGKEKRWRCRVRPASSIIKCVFSIFPLLSGIFKIYFSAISTTQG